MSVDPLFLSFQLALAGRYSIDRELGRGGMGIVYLAREVHLDRLVAIKLLPPEKARQPSLRERFLREARLAAKLSHPNIIPIHAVEETGGFVYYVMAFIEGETLAHRVRTRGPLPSSEAARVLREVAWALAYAHGQGLVHRDVKPDNILLESASGRALVADFGIAAVSGDGMSEGVTGTPEFMSPEQALGAVIDARSDLYGWGVTAFYALSGRLPFEGASATAILARHVTEMAPPLGSLGLPVPRRLAALVDRCLAKDAGQRPASAQAVAEQLGLALEQRRELPAALRAFVKRSGRLNGGGTLVAGIGLVPISTTVAAYFGGASGFTAFTLGLTVLPFSYLIFQARRLTRLGFAHADLGPAFKAEIDQATEELTLGRRQGPTFVERALGLTARTSGLVGAVSIGALLFSQRGLVILGNTAIFSFATASLTTLGWLALRQRHRDVDTAFWSRLWMGPIGRLAFAVGRRIAGRRVQPAALTHRPTELSLGMAAEQLYESLPKETRRALGDLPAVLTRLQEDAQLLRKRHDELQEALGDGESGASEAWAELRATRDTVRARLSDAVSALETIRLNLLRLHAGSATVEGLTTHLGLAADVSAQIERLIAAHDDVARELEFPRSITPTPA